MSLDGAYDPANVFARILRGELPSVPVCQDDAILAFMDVFPQAEGHVLVIPKTGMARNLLEVDPATLALLIAAVQRVAAAVRTALQPDGLMVAQFNGAAAGQTVDHLHFHVIPRWEDRPMKGHGHGEMADAGTLRALADRIAAALPPA